jgi:hypothetical protein
MVASEIAEPDSRQFLTELPAKIGFSVRHYLGKSPHPQNITTLRRILREVLETIG